MKQLIMILFSILILSSCEDEFEISQEIKAEIPEQYGYRLWTRGHVTYSFITEYSFIDGSLVYLDSMKCIEYNSMKKKLQSILNFKPCKK